MKKILLWISLALIVLMGIGFAINGLRHLPNFSVQPAVTLGQVAGSVFVIFFLSYIPAVAVFEKINRG